MALHDPGKSGRLRKREGNPVPFSSEGKDACRYPLVWGRSPRPHGRTKARPEFGCGAVLAGWLVVCPVLLSVALSGEGRERRARPPQWNNLPPGIFFEDAFRQGLSGPPPRQPAIASDAKSSLPDEAAPDSPASELTAGWTETISADTIEDEIKAILGRISELVANAGQFKGQGYRQARREYTVAADVVCD